MMPHADRRHFSFAALLTDPAVWAVVDLRDDDSWRGGDHFEFMGGPVPRVRITRWCPVRPTCRQFVHRHGTITLSEHDLHRLDGLMALYRGDRLSECISSAIEYVTLVWYRDDREVGAERYWSCAIPFDDEHLLRFDSLASRLSPDGPREQRRPANWQRQIAEEARAREERAAAERSEMVELILELLRNSIDAWSQVLELVRRERYHAQPARSDESDEVGRAACRIRQWVQSQVLLDDRPPEGSFGAKLCDVLIVKERRAFFRPGGLAYELGVSEVDVMRTSLAEVDWEAIAERVLRDA